MIEAEVVTALQFSQLSFYASDCNLFVQCVRFRLPAASTSRNPFKENALIFVVLNSS